MGKTFGNLLTRLGTGISEIVGAVTDDAIGITGKTTQKGVETLTHVGTDGIGAGYNLVKDVAKAGKDLAVQTKDDFQDENPDLIDDVKYVGSAIKDKLIDLKDKAVAKGKDIKERANTAVKEQKAKANTQNNKQPKRPSSATPATDKVTDEAENILKDMTPAQRKRISRKLAATAQEEVEAIQKNTKEEKPPVSTHSV